MSVGAKTQRKILEAAEEIFIRYGYEGARMELIAESAGVLKANIYYYYKGKEELYNALINDVLNRVFSEVQAFLGRPNESPWQRMDLFLNVFFDLIENYRGLLGLAFGELLHPPKERKTQSEVMQALSGIEQVAIGLIRDGIDRGVFGPNDPAQTLLTLEGVVYYYFLMPSERLESITGKAQFDPEALSERKEHLRAVIRRILE